MRNLRPWLTVVIPTYDRTTELQRAIGSVRALGCDGIEIIVVDDGSASVTEEALAGIDERELTLLFNDGNKGVSATRNHGAAEARGKWLWFLDSDDEIVAGSFPLLDDKLRDSEADVVYFHAESRQPNGTSTVFESQFLPRNCSRSELLAVRNRPFTQSQMIIKSSFFERIGGFDEDFRFGEDLDLWVRLINEGCRLAYVPSVAIIKHEGTRHSLSRQTAIAYQNSRRRWRKHARLLRPELSRQQFQDWQFQQLESRYYVIRESREVIRSLPWSQRLDFCWRWTRLAVAARPSLRRKVMRRLLETSSWLFVG